MSAKSNQLIAVMLGNKLTDDNAYILLKKGRTLIPNYHKSWDEFMIVYKKLKFFLAGINEHDQEQVFSDFKELQEHICYADLKTAYDYLVQCIKGLNKSGYEDIISG